MTTPFPFVSGAVLTAAQLNDITNLPINDQTASYTLVVGDAGKRVIMNAAGATTITVDDSVFTTGDTIFIANKGAGVSTVTAGSGVTINTSDSLALAQYQSGTLVALSASSFLFFTSSEPAGGMTLLSTTTLTGASTAVTSIDQTYNALFITVEKWYASSAAYLRGYQNADSTSGNYLSLYTRLRVGGSAENSAGTYELTGWTEGTSQQDNLQAIIIPNYAGSSMKIWQSYGYMDTDNAAKGVFYGAGSYFSTTAITSITFAPSAGTFSAGTVKIYGVK